MQQVFDIIVNDPFWRSVVASCFLIIIVSLLKLSISNRILRKSSLKASYRRRQLVHLNNLSFLIIFVGFFFLWQSQIEQAAVSMIAVAVAIVIATKEWISNLLGGIFRFRSRPFSVGDRIEVAGLRGNVINQSLLTTTLLEVGPESRYNLYTGKAITIPNVKFLSEAIITEHITGGYVFHCFKVPIKLDSDWESSIQTLREAAWAVAGQYVDDAKKRIQKLGAKEGFETPGAEPRVSISLSNSIVTKENFSEALVRVPVPTGQKSSIEDEILEVYLSKVLQSNSKEETKTNGVEEPITIQ